MEKRVKKETEVVEEEVETLIDGDRLINFSDAVFAFAATLLVLKIDLPVIPPHLVDTQFSTELLKLWPAYTANIISFILIGYYWRLHHKLFILIKRYDDVLVWINIVLLICVAFLPFPVDVFGDYPNSPPVLMFYTASVAIVGFVMLVIWLYASHNYRLIDKKMSQRMIEYQTLSVMIAPVVFTIAIPLTFIDHIVAKLSWIFVIVLFFLLNRFYKVGKQQKKEFDPQPE